MRKTERREQVTLPLSFRVPSEQLSEIDREVARDHRKERVALVEPIWSWAWAAYRKVGALRKLLEGTTIRVLSDRVSTETQEEMYSALELILQRAPSTVVEKIAEKLTEWAGKYGEEKVVR